MNEHPIRRIVFWSGRIFFLGKRLISFALISRKINKLKKRQDKLRIESFRLRTKEFRPEIDDLERRIVEESRKFMKWVKK